MEIGKTIVMIIIIAGLEVESMVFEKNHFPQVNSEELIELTSENLENFLDEFVHGNMETAHVPGLVITVVHGNEVIFAKGYGNADMENQIQMTPQTNIRAGSVSKSVLATGIIKLVEQGILDLNAPVSDYMSDLNLKDDFGPASTIGQLLTHTSGYPETLVLSHSPDLESDETLSEVLHADLPPRAFAPGLISSYSDWNFSLLGYAIEGATGKPYETVMEEILFSPLGMKNSTFEQPLPEKIFNNLAVGYGWKYAKNKYAVVPHDFVRMSPGIAFVTNGEDLGVYMMMLLNEGSLHGNQYFNDESMELLLERQGSAHPYSRGWSYGFIENTIAGRKVFYKDGNGIGFSSRIVLMPKHNLGIFVSTNHRNLGEGLWLTEAAMMATRTLVSAIFEKFVPETEREIPDVQPLAVDPDHLKKFEGHYQKAGISRNDFLKLEGLLDNVTVKNNGDGTLQIGSGVYQEVEPLVFQNGNIPSFFAIFVENPSGELEYLTFGGTGSYQKVPWYQTKNIQMILVVAIALISLAMVIAWLITRQGHWVALTTSLLNIGFIVGLGMLLIPSITDMLVFFKSIPIRIRILFALPWLIGILALSLTIFFVVGWKESAVPYIERILYPLVAAASFTLFWLANFWNLVLR